MMAKKKYIDYMKELSKDEIAIGLFIDGFFSKEFPDIFQSKKFYEVVSKNKTFFNQNISEYNTKTKSSIPISHEAIKHSNETRTINIPNPFHYYNQCFLIADNYDEICDHFEAKTHLDSNKVSLKHITKETGKTGLFESYDYDGNLTGLVIEEKDSIEIIEKNILEKYNYESKVDKRYKVEADISNYFRSIYTHSIAWAVIGKEETRKEMKADPGAYKKKWYAQLDYVTSLMNERQTSGVLVGIDSSNIISEILLVSIDDKLRNPKWTFNRYTDDYVVYVNNENDANEFLIQLRSLLKEFNLFLNSKKTKIIRLPDTEENAVEEIKQNPYIHLINLSNGVMKAGNDIGEKFVISYFKEMAKIAKKHNDASVIKYGLKVLKSANMTKEATTIFIMETIHLVTIYPYLIKIVDELVLREYSSKLSTEERSIINKAFKRMYSDAILEKNYEMWMYLLKLAIDYDYDLEINHEEILHSNNSIIFLLGYLNHRKNKNDYNYASTEINYKESAEKIAGCNSQNKIGADLDSFQENWIFVYELLDKGKFENEWKFIKNKNVSFLKKEYRSLLLGK